MYDKELIEKVCNLTCTYKDISKNQTSIKYDHIYPFKKYYNVNTIIGALDKYLNKEWDAQMLSNWCCIYNWIILGGFYRNVQEDFNPLEQFIVDTLTWHLDGLSFFDDDGNEEAEPWIQSSKENFINYDYVLKTKESWKGIYATVGPYDVDNKEQYVVLVNDNLKKFMILHGDHLHNGYKYKNEYFRYTVRNKFISLIEDFKAKGYSLLSCDEELYYDDLNDLD